MGTGPHIPQQGSWARLQIYFQALRIAGFETATTPADKVISKMTTQTLSCLLFFFPTRTQLRTKRSQDWSQQGYPKPCTQLPSSVSTV